MEQSAVVLTLPTLYKHKPGAKAAQQWRVEVVKVFDANTVETFSIDTHSGQVGGIQTAAHKLVTQGKNLGRSNATTAEQQAVAEARAMHEKKRAREGYCDSLADAAAGKSSSAVDVAAPPAPMLAKVWEDEFSKVAWPAWCQKKFDGHRCVAKLSLWHGKDEGGIDCFEDVTVSLWSRKRERITSMPHVEQELQRMLEQYLSTAPGTGVEKLRRVGFDSAECEPWVLVLDGELYCHDLSFERMSSLVRNKTVQPGHNQVKLHVFDQQSPLPFLKRLCQVEPLFLTESAVKLELPVFVADAAAAEAERDRCVAEGYEGAMLRHGSEGYRVCVGAVICRDDAGNEIKFKPAVPDEVLREQRTSRSWIGKRAPFKYQERTSKGVARFPIGTGLPVGATESPLDYIRPAADRPSGYNPHRPICDCCECRIAGGAS